MLELATYLVDDSSRISCLEHHLPDYCKADGNVRFGDILLLSLDDGSRPHPAG